MPGCFPDRIVDLNGRPYRIIGVAPEGFEGLNTLTATDIWVPMALYRDLYPMPDQFNQRRYLALLVVGRLQTWYWATPGAIGHADPLAGSGTRIPNRKQGAANAPDQGI